MAPLVAVIDFGWLEQYYIANNSFCPRFTQALQPPVEALGAWSFYPNSFGVNTAVLLNTSPGSSV